MSVGCGAVRGCVGAAAGVAAAAAAPAEVDQVPGPGLGWPAGAAPRRRGTQSSLPPPHTATQHSPALQTIKQLYAQINRHTMFYLILPYRYFDYIPSIICIWGI